MDDHDRLAHAVCEKLLDVAMAQNDSDFAELAGGLEKLEREVIDALKAWEAGFPELDCRDMI